MKKIKLTQLSILTLLSLSTLSAGEFQPIGQISTSMGGVGVASSKGAMASYFNPALLTQQKEKIDLRLGVGAAIRENNIGEKLDTLSNLELTDTIERISNNIGRSNTQEDRDNVVKAQDLLKEIGTQNGLSVMPSAYFATQVNDYAIGIYATSDISASAVVDKNRLALSVQGDDGKYYNYDPTTDNYSIISQAEYNAHSLESATGTNGTTYVNVKGLALLEVPVSYAKAYNLKRGELSVGGSLKFMRGSTFLQKVDIDSESGKVNDDLEQNQKDSSNVGIDLGLLFKPSQIEKLSIGLVAKNINAPTFDTYDGGSIKADMQLRTGLLYNLNEEVELAMDLDLIANETFIPGYESQQIGAGVNYKPSSWFSIRAGLMQNLANNNDGLVYSTGFGIGVEALTLDVAAQMSSKSGSYDGEDVPTYAKVNVALISRW